MFQPVRKFCNASLTRTVARISSLVVSLDMDKTSKHRRYFVWDFLT